MLRGGLIGRSDTPRLESWGVVEGAAIVAVCGEGAAGHAQGGVTTYSDARAMLEAETLDFVDLALPPAERRAAIELAASRVTAVFCDAPVAATISDGEAMLAACGAANTALIVHQPHRFDEAVGAVGREIETGTIGTPHYARLHLRNAPAVSGDGFGVDALTGPGACALDAALWLLGDVQRVHCRSQSFGQDSAWDAATLTLDHGGAIALVDASLARDGATEAPADLLIRIEGDRATVELVEGRRMVVSGDGPRREQDFGAGGREAGRAGLLAAQRSLVGWLARGERPVSTGEDALAALRLVARAADSAKTGRAL